MQVEQNKESKSKKGRVNEIGGFRVDRIRGDVMRKFVADHGLADKVETDVSDEMLGVALSQHFINKVKKESQVRCDLDDGGCGGVSSDELEECPYCGDLGEVEAASSDRSDEDDEVSDDDEEEVETAPADEGDKGDEPPTAEEEDGEEEAQASPPPAPKKSAAKKKAKEDKMQTEMVNGHGAKKGRSTALVSARELDVKVSEVRKWQKAIAESTFEGAVAYWNLGRSLLDINTEDLWKLRVDEKTEKPAHKSFDRFVREELGMSPQHAYSAIDVAREYENPEEVQAIGQTKAVLLLKAAPEDRPALKEEAKKGATVRELSSKVKESRKKHGSPKKSQQAKAGSKGGASKAKKTKARAEKVSIVSFEGKKTIDLYKKPESTRGVIDLKKCSRAKSIGDQPFGIYEMANGIVQHFFVSVKDGKWQLRIETRRLET